MFTRVQHDLTKTPGRQVQLTPDVQNELEAWRDIVSSLSSRTTHLREMHPFPPTYMGTDDNSGPGMGVIY